MFGSPAPAAAATLPQARLESANKFLQVQQSLPASRGPAAASPRTSGRCRFQLRKGVCSYYIHRFARRVPVCPHLRAGLRLPPQGTTSREQDWYNSAASLVTPRVSAAANPLVSATNNPVPICSRFR